MNTTINSVNKSGNLNPMHGKRHSLATKQKISDSQKQRYAAIRKALKEGDILNYGKTTAEARKEVLLHLLDNNNLNFKNVQQAVNFLAIMLNENKIKQIIEECLTSYIQNNTRPLNRKCCFNDNVLIHN